MKARSVSEIFRETSHCDTRVHRGQGLQSGVSQGTGILRCTDLDTDVFLNLLDAERLAEKVRMRLRNSR